MEGQALFSVSTGMALFFISHIWLWRRKPSNNPRILRLAILGGIGIAVSEFTEVFRVGFDPMGLTVVTGFCIFILIFYLVLYAAVARSVSVTLLTRFFSAGHEPLDVSTLCEEYQSSSRFDDRVRLMHQNGLVRLKGQTVVLSSQGRRLAQITKVLAGVLTDGMEG
jgi:hypothetical protein